MARHRVLTGITTTGTPHLGNYVGAIRPAIESSKQDDVDAYLFLADYHALIKSQDPNLVAESSLEIAATWLALGLDPDQTHFYRQSDIPEITELSWILTCNAAKGLMNRAHAYKAAVQGNEEAGEDPDYAITMGLFSYPILMAADILIFNAHDVPVGRDQIQHVEMARDIAARFNHHYGETFVLPKAVVDDDVAVLLGLDGRKMSKSYGNTIPLFGTPKQLQKSINKIKTNLLSPVNPKTLIRLLCFKSGAPLRMKPSVRRCELPSRRVSRGVRRKSVYSNGSMTRLRPRAMNTSGLWRTQVRWSPSCAREQSAFVLRVRLYSTK